MEYIPGILHEKLQMPIAIECNGDFNLHLCKKRYADTPLVGNEHLDILSLVCGDIVILKWFKPKDAYVGVYFDKMYRDGIEIEIKKETILSKEFVEINSKNSDSIFRIVTKQYNRLEKINKLII